MLRSLPRRIEQVHLSISSLSVLPSPVNGRVGIRDFTFEACSSSTRVAACQIACPPKADVCPEAPTQPVTRRSRSVATMHIDVYMDGSSSHWRPAPLRRTANGSGKLERRAEVLSASRGALNGGSATKSKLLIGKRAYSEAEHWPKSLQDLESIVVLFRQILD